MRSLTRINRIHLKCPPQVAYDLVTTPDNWVGTHPVTAEVHGENTDHSAVQGARWTEIIASQGTAPFKAEWTVTEAIPGARWVIVCPNLRDPGVHCQIVYSFDEVDGGTEFTREMTVRSPENDTHGTYLENVKRALEG
ncbi:SRPBCC family protein [Streptomyces sp. NPDC008092]|uniref:SRPBCC family protein n=1 Tax=Streptomyces sp. NPDC008092 TaxID=3364808 RepID=UPI0036DFD5AC